MSRCLVLEVTGETAQDDEEQVIIPAKMVLEIRTHTENDARGMTLKGEAIVFSENPENRNEALKRTFKLGDANCINRRAINNYTYDL